MQYAINRRAWGSLSLAKGPSARSVAAHIGIAVGCALGALIVRTAIETIEPGAAQLIVALPAVVLAGALAGVWPAIVTALLAGIGIEFLFAWSDFTAWPPLSGGQAHFLFYLAACASVLWPTARLRRSTAMAAAAEARLREVLRQVPAAVAILEAPRGNLLLRSSLSTSILGHDPYPMRSASGLSAYHGFHADGRQYLPGDYPISRALDGEVVIAEPIRYHHPDGFQVDLEVHAGPVRSGDGEIIAAVGMAFDVSDRRDAERRLRESELRHRELSESLNAALDVADLGTCEMDLATRRVRWDARMAAMMGLPPEPVEFELHELERFFDPDDVAGATEAFSRVSREGGAYAWEFRGRSVAGKQRWLILRGGIPKDAGKAVGVIQDITDRKLREDALRDLAETRALLMREADHRIKNSLQLVVSLLTVQSAALKDGDGKEALRAAIGRINAVADGHMALQLSPNFTTIDVSAMIADLCQRLATLNPAAKIVSAAAPAIVLGADIAIPLEMILSEILTNALRHAFPPGAAGAIHVETRRTDNRIAIEIADDGVGLPVAGSGQSRKGLGSIIIQSLAQQIGAEIATTSLPGKGAAVTVSLALP